MLNINDYKSGKPLSHFGAAKSFLANKNVPIEKLRKNPSLYTVQRYCALPEEIKTEMQFTLVTLVTLLRSFQPEPHQGKTILSLSYQQQIIEEEMEIDNDEDDIGLISFDYNDGNKHT